jgi:hypothetical protein
MNNLNIQIFAHKINDILSFDICECKSAQTKLPLEFPGYILLIIQTAAIGESLLKDRSVLKN